MGWCVCTAELADEQTAAEVKQPVCGSSEGCPVRSNGAPV